MGASFEDKNRSVIPRWRASRLTTDLGELVSLNRRVGALSEGALEEKVEEWRRGKTLSRAAEVVGASIVLGREDVAREAASFIIAAGERTPARVHELAALILEPNVQDYTDPAEQPRGREVALLRRRLRTDPRNAIAWADLSREYATLGLAERASRAMRVALDLAPDHRFILRCATRLFVHLDDPERAHHLLLRSQATASDPWLMSAEIAVASVAGEPPEFVKIGRGLARSEQFSPWHLSELAAALGTLEFEHGSQRAGRKYFRDALRRPTANTVGQARWLQNNKTDLQLLDAAALDTRCAYEARAWQAFYVGGWQTSLNETLSWLGDEPYSSRPAVLGSYITSSILERYREAVEMARSGLRANPDDMILLNNLAFGLINCGEFEDAEGRLQQLRALGPDDSQDILLKATAGLLKFRRGDPDAGRVLYRAAIQKAERHGFPLLRARAAVFLALEERRAKSLYAKDAAAKALSYASSIPNADLRFLLGRLRPSQGP